MSKNKKRVKRKQNGRFSIIDIVDQTAEDGTKVKIRGDEMEMTKEEVTAILSEHESCVNQWKKALNKINVIEAEEQQTI